MPKSTHAMTRVAGLLVAASLIAAPVRAEPTTDAAAQAEQSSSAAESWMMMLMTNRFSEKLDFATGPACAEAALAMRQLGTIARYGDIFCIHQASGDVFHIDRRGNLQRAEQ